MSGSLDRIAHGHRRAQVTVFLNASAISLNVTPIRPRRFTRGSLARAQTILPLKVYSCPPIVIDPSPACLAMAPASTQHRNRRRRRRW